jgi:hypothetical protein
MAAKKKVENFIREINEEEEWTELCSQQVRRSGQNSAAYR